MSSVHQKDTTFTKIFVGGLPYHTTDESLREFFQQFGDIEEAVVITDRQTGKSRGYGFVTMVDRAAAERACKDPNPIIDGRKANVNLAYLGAKPRVQATTLPFAIKAASVPAGYMTGQVHGLPQYIYPASAYMTAQGAGMAAMPISPQSPLSPSTAGLSLDYTTAGYPATAQLPAGYEAAYPYSTTASYVTPAAYSAYAAATGLPLTAGVGPFTTHQAAQQLQERLQ